MVPRGCAIPVPWEWPCLIKVKIMAAEKVANSLPIETFNPEQDDFDEWIARLEMAIVLATNVTDNKRKDQLCRDWLSLKLDDRSRIILGNCKEKEWSKLKEELGNLLIDPQERYNWRARRSTITWDGRESFHVLAAKVKRAVDKFDPKSNKEQEYFFRFRDALPLEYRKAIDLGVAEDKQTIEEAKKIALRVQMASSDESEMGATAQPKNPVSFVGASFTDDGLGAVESAIKRLSIKVDDMDSEIERMHRRIDKRDESSRKWSDHRHHKGRNSDRYSDQSKEYNRSHHQDSCDRDKDDNDEDRQDWRDYRGSHGDYEYRKYSDYSDRHYSRDQSQDHSRHRSDDRMETDKEEAYQWSCAGKFDRGRNKRK